MPGKPIKIIITGASGQLGSELKIRKNNPSFEMIFTDLPDLDLNDKPAVKDFILERKPDFIINCAAYTAVDKAESEKELAYSINADVPDHIAGLCEASGINLIHISTDFVFPGTGNTPIREDDETKPVNHYGKTKLEGEKKVLQNCRNAIILRTSWLYAVHGHNFVNTMIKASSERDLLRVVYDQVGSPTFAGDLAEAILEMITKLNSGSNDIKQLRGIYHYSNEGVASWYDFASAVFKIKKIRTRLIPVSTADYPTPARRPAYSVLDKTRIKENFGLSIPYWRDSLEKCLSQMNF